MFNSYKKGIHYEKIACFYLKKLGWNIIKNRYKNQFGEIDIIAIKAHTLIACEVKFRNKTNEAAFSIKKNQKQRIFNAFEYFLSENECLSKQYPFKRIDAILISSHRDIEHIENAWQIDSEFYE